MNEYLNYLNFMNGSGNANMSSSNNNNNNMSMFQTSSAITNPIGSMDSYTNPIGASNISNQYGSGVDWWGTENSSNTLLGNNASSTSMFGDFLGEDGWGNTAMQGASSLAQSWLGFQNLGIAEDQLQLGQDAFSLQKEDYERSVALNDAARLGAK